MASINKFGWGEFLTGIAVGSLISLIFSRKDLKGDVANIHRKAEEIKNKLTERAKNISSDIIEKSHGFIESAKKFAEGRYSGTIESLEKEYNSIRYAINTAVDNYRRNSEKILSQNNGEIDDLYIDFDDETLPKFVGMGRRRR